MPGRHVRCCFSGTSLSTGSSARRRRHPSIHAPLPRKIPPTAAFSGKDGGSATPASMSILKGRAIEFKSYCVCITEFQGPARCGAQCRSAPHAPRHAIVPSKSEPGKDLAQGCDCGIGHLVLVGGIPRTFDRREPCPRTRGLRVAGRRDGRIEGRSVRSENRIDCGPRHGYRRCRRRCILRSGYGSREIHQRFRWSAQCRRHVG